MDACIIQLFNQEQFCSKENNCLEITSDDTSRETHNVRLSLSFYTVQFSAETLQGKAWLTVIIQRPMDS